MACRYLWNFNTVINRDLYSCDATLFFLGNDPRVVSVDGTHLQGQTNANVERILIFGQQVPFFPQDMQSFFGALQAIEFWQTSLNNITMQDLVPFQQLRDFIFDENQINMIPGNLFMFNPQLMRVDFSHNRNLQVIQNNLFGNSPNLIQARFINSNCIDEQAMNRQQVENLNQRLHLLCNLDGPPTTTTTWTPPTTTSTPTTTTPTTTWWTTTQWPPQECQAGCQNQINNLAQDNAELRMRIQRIENGICQVMGQLC
jgi:hypothetical protein